MKRACLGGCAAAALATAIGCCGSPHRVRRGQRPLRRQDSDQASGWPPTPCSCVRCPCRHGCRRGHLGRVGAVSRPRRQHEEATRVLIEDPAAYTFQRPLGDFSRCEPYTPRPAGPVATRCPPRRVGQDPTHKRRSSSTEADAQTPNSTTRRVSAARWPCAQERSLDRPADGSLVVVAAGDDGQRAGSAV